MAGRRHKALAPALAATARAGDEGGVTTPTLMDHWLQMEAFAPSQDPMLEGYTSLGFVAAQTQRVILGLLVTGVTYRYPGLLAKTVTTLDVLSGGRALFRIGAAWFEREHLGLGVPFLPVEQRRGTVGRQALPARRDDLLTRADPAGQPADPDRRERGSLDVLARHCADLGRDPATVEKTIIRQWDPFEPGFLPAMQAYAAVEQVEQVEQVGQVEQVALTPMCEDPADWVRQVCEQVLPRLAEL